MQAEIITIGDELLIGMTVDTNSSWMGEYLTALGIEVYQVTTISDKRDHILSAIDIAMNRSDIVLVTGGLGPTSDDITKETIAEYFGSGLVRNDLAYSSVEKLLNARGLEMNDNNMRQALVPDSCIVLPNGKGTAPGMLFEKGERILIAMPGVPYEMKDIMVNQVSPYLKEHFSSSNIIYRLIMVYGTFEAKLAEILEPFEANLPENISLAYLPTAGIIKLRLTARGKDEDILVHQLDNEINSLREIIPEFIYGYNGEKLEECVGRLMSTENLTLGIAESCTGGNISHMLTSVPGSSEYLTGSVIAYSNSVKINDLGIPEEMLEKSGAVSREVVIAMAEGARKRFDSDFSVATTGIAGPGGGSAGKPVGTVWIAVSSDQKTVAEKYTFGNIRESNIRRASLAALDMLRKQIIEAAIKI